MQCGPNVELEHGARWGRWLRRRDAWGWKPQRDLRGDRSRDDERGRRAGKSGGYWESDGLRRDSALVQWRGAHEGRRASIIRPLVIFRRVELSYQFSPHVRPADSARTPPPTFSPASTAPRLQPPGGDAPPRKSPGQKRLIVLVLARSPPRTRLTTRPRPRRPA